LDIQEAAEQVIRDNGASLATHNANNQAMLYLDSSNGDVLAYVGSRDYFNDEIE
jgi:membrane carboxypeptidase/penicillin-binding protein PbpC